MARGSTFGLRASRRARGGGGYGAWRGSRGRGRGRGGSSSNQPGPARGDDGTQTEERFENVKVNDEVDEKLGFPRVSEGPRQEGWLVNMHPVSDQVENLGALSDAFGQTLLKDSDWPGGRAAVDYYFLKDDGGMFKCTLPYEPYFHISCKAGLASFCRVYPLILGWFLGWYGNHH
jgi:DNA polymerase epsilon subunit 1